MQQYTKILLSKRPDGLPISADLFEVVKEDIPTPEAGQILVKQTHMSLDPAMIGWMNSDPNSYIAPVELGSVMRSSGVGEVVESQHPDFTVGDKVMGMMGWSEYILSNAQGLNKVPAGVDAEMALAVFAIPGITATHGLFNIGKPKAGETLIVTGAAGSVGSIVGQLAKAEGLRVIGVVGSDEKANWVVNELGFDGAINYHSDNLNEQLIALTPDGIDVFFENTGGPIQHHIVQHMNNFGRVIVCGMISDYNTTKPSPGPNWIPLIKKRITIQGFAVPDHLAEIPALMTTLSPYVMQGKVKYRSHILEGLESAMTGINLFFSGENQGKLMVKLV
jgi:NADPH-dependent curcumin reductase CurA